LVKTGRTAERLTVLSSLQPGLTISITFGKIYFLINFRIFYIFVKNGQKIKFPGFNVNRLEIKLRAQRGMAFLIPTLIRKIFAKIPMFLIEK